MSIPKSNDVWDVVYKKAVQDDGTLLFPERLSWEFLEQARRSQGSYIFANQYQNEIIPDGEQTFQKHWIRYYGDLPKLYNSFAFVDPAISEAASADFTGVTVVSVDSAKNWYVRISQRYKLNPTQLINLLFRIHTEYKTNMIGIEDVAFQRAILHFAHEEMRRRGTHIPITGVKVGVDKTKEMRILSLVPRFEFGTIFLSTACKDLELELAQFPRGSHDDCVDALSGLENIVYYPSEPRRMTREPQPNDPGYEKWFIQQLAQRANNSE